MTFSVRIAVKITDYCYLSIYLFIHLMVYLFLYCKYPCLSFFNVDPNRGLSSLVTTAKRASQSLSRIMNIVRPVSRIHLSCISPAIEQVLGQSFRRPFSSPRPPLVPILSSVPDLTDSHISPRRGTPLCAVASLRYQSCIHTCITAQQVPQPPLPGYVTALREQHFPATESGFLTILDGGIALSSPPPLD